MAKQTINIGTTANDGTGDPIRAAFGKVNDNFTEIYTANTGVNTGDQNLSAYATTAAVAAGYQPLDSDLTAISALTTTAYGRALLSTTDAATLRSAIGVGTTDAPTFAGVTMASSTSLLSHSAGAGVYDSRVNLKLLVDNAAFSNNLSFRYAGGSMVQVWAGQTPAGVASFGSEGFNVVNKLGFSTVATNAPIVVLEQDAAGILAQRNGTSAQAFRVYNTYPGTTANEWGEIDWKTTGNVLRIGTAHAGTGGSRALEFATSNTGRWQVSGGSGHFLASTDNTYDIGASGANRPRFIYAGSGIDAGSGSISTFSGLRTISCAFTTAGHGTAATFQFYSPGDGVLRITNGATTDLGRLQLGGTTDAFPAIARDGAGIKFTGAATGLTSWIKVPAVAVASLPLAATAGVGARSFVNDALSPVFGSAVTGGGAVTVPVYSTGSAWNVG